MFKDFAHDDAPHDPVSRLASLTSDLPGGTANDLTINAIAYNPASQIVSQMRAPDAYAWRGHSDGTWTGTANGLNQLTQYGAKALSHDQKGNVTAFGSATYTYSSENLLLTGPGSASLAYDGLTRLRQIVSGGATTRFAYDRLDRIAEYNGSNLLQRRYVFGSSIDEPIVWYEGGGTTDRRFLSSDERGSIVSVTNASGALLGINRYDEFGIPASTNLGKWGYTGQAWLPEIGVYYYKARMYEPELGRFLQPDPIGCWDGPNLYAYVLNDPINFVDPLGLELCYGGPVPCPDIIVIGGGRGSGGIVGGSGSFNGLSSTVQRTQIESHTSPNNSERAEFCRRFLYRLSAEVDRIAGYGQLLALGGVGLAKTEFDPGQRVALSRAAWVIYGYLGAARTAATLGKIFAGDHMSIGDLAGTLAVKISGLDKLGESVGGTAQDVANRLVRGDPCPGAKL